MSLLSTALTLSMWRPATQNKSRWTRASSMNHSRRRDFLSFFQASPSDMGILRHAECLLCLGRLTTPGAREQPFQRVPARNTDIHECAEYA
ncbi:hypothetical protein BKA93DRAFT_615887 [Sparassis latifolia]